MPQGLIIVTPTSQYTSYSAMFRPLHSNVSKERHEKHVCNSSSHYRKYRKFTHETCAHISIRESQNAPISAMSNLFHNIIGME